MSLKIKCLLFFTLPLISYAQMNCSELSKGIFEIKTEYGNILVERFNNFQLEKFVEFGILYLYKIEKVNECDYILKIQKIISKGDLLEPSLNQNIEVNIYNVTDNVFYYHSLEKSSQIKTDGKMEKKSDTISDEFKKILSQL